MINKLKYFSYSHWLNGMIAVMGNIGEPLDITVRLLGAGFIGLILSLVIGPFAIIPAVTWLLYPHAVMGFVAGVTYSLLNTPIVLYNQVFVPVVNAIITASEITARVERFIINGFNRLFKSQDNIQITIETSQQNQNVSIFRTSFSHIYLRLSEQDAVIPVVIPLSTTDIQEQENTIPVAINLSLYEVIKSFWFGEQSVQTIPQASIVIPNPPTHYNRL